MLAALHHFPVFTAADFAENAVMDSNIQTY
jgi:hypothetical protein